MHWSFSQVNIFYTLRVLQKTSKTLMKRSCLIYLSIFCTTGILFTVMWCVKLICGSLWFTCQNTVAYFIKISEGERQTRQRNHKRELCAGTYAFVLTHHWQDKCYHLTLLYNSTRWMIVSLNTLLKQWWPGDKQCYESAYLTS